MFRKFLSFIIIFALVGISAITLIAFVSHAGCLVQTLQGGGCPANVGSILFLNFHINAFSQLSLAISLFFLLFITVLFVEQTAVFHSSSVTFFISQKNLFCSSLQKYRRWLSLNELSPSYI
ncbi:hypothetical protein C4565_07515 [Candidatus Parcubacteria bacterium]|jgi:hypothetical protein|nr:MAG: hypothetical protein C4565_07515 [Candidatus Parcubacteria bacterium]